MQGAGMQGCRGFVVFLLPRGSGGGVDLPPPSLSRSREPVSVRKCSPMEIFCRHLDYIWVDSGVNVCWDTWTHMGHVNDDALI
jgi:hypothetical protein